MASTGPSSARHQRSLGVSSIPLIPEKDERSLGTDSQWVGDADLKREAERRRSASKTVWGTLLLAYQCLGVIYGDIGTSPLYVFATAFADRTPSSEDVLGAFSIIFWTFTLLVMIKYVSVVFYADDNGEGGTFAMYTLLSRHIGLTATGSMNSQDHKQLLAIKSVARPPAQGQRRWWHSEVGPHLRRYFRQSPRVQLVLMIVVIFSVGLVLSDGVLTPTLSVMSAVGGLTQASSAITQTTIVGISEGILILLFLSQSLGTHRVSMLFAPIVALWLLSNAGIGIFNMITYNPHVLKAINPYYIYKFFKVNAYEAWSELGGLMLCITGTEAMFADMGHFSRTSIKVSAWFVVYPALIITYAGQAAYLTQHPDRVLDTYWASIPHSIFWPMLVLATLAAIVASQALITGSFSIIRQAMSLGLFPKLEVVHTSDEHEGQIYIAEVNYALMILCVAVVAGFQNGLALGNAYGVAVMAVMLCTTCLIALVELIVWEITPFLVVPSFLFIFTIEMIYWSANLLKVPQGGWFTLAVACVVAVIKLTWWAGGRRKRKCAKQGPSLQDSFNLARNSAGQQCLYLTAYPKAPLSRPAGLGIYYTDSTSGTPAVMAHLATNMGSLQEVVILMTVRFLPLPHVERGERLLIRVLPSIANSYQVVARYGYQDTVDHGPDFIRFMVSHIARYTGALQESATDPAAGRTVMRNSVRRSFAMSRLPSLSISQPLPEGLSVLPPLARVTGGSGGSTHNRSVRSGDGTPTAADAGALASLDGGGGGGSGQLPPYTLTALASAVPADDTSDYDGGDSQDGADDFDGMEHLGLGDVAEEGEIEIDVEQATPASGPLPSPGAAAAAPYAMSAAAPSGGVAALRSMDRASVRGVGRISRSSRPLAALSRGNGPLAARSVTWGTFSAGGEQPPQRLAPEPVVALETLAVPETADVLTLLEAADRAVVYYVGKVGLRVAPTGNAIKKIFYNQFYGLLDRMSWRDWEAWAIPTNRMVAVDVVYKLD